MSETIKDNIIINEKVSTKSIVDYAEGVEYSLRLSNHSSDISHWCTDEQILHFMKKLGYENRSLYDVPEDVAYIFKKMPELTLEGSFKILKDSVIYYKDDENVPYNQYEEWKRLAALKDLDSKEGLMSTIALILGHLLLPSNFILHIKRLGLSLILMTTPPFQ